MSAATAPTPDERHERPPFADASPARVRAVLVPEDVAEFDRQWRAAMAAATEDLDLAVVHRTLESWRRIAWLTVAHGPDGYRQLLERAAERGRVGPREPGGVPLDQVKALIAERLG